MIRIVNAQGFPQLVNDLGTTFELPLTLVRELYRAQPHDKDELRIFLLEWGADPVGVLALVQDDYSPALFLASMVNLGLSLESVRDLEEELAFFRDAYGKPPRRLILQPSEWGMLTTQLIKTECIHATELHREDAVRRWLIQRFELEAVEVEAAVMVGRFQ